MKERENKIKKNVSKVNAVSDTSERNLKEDGAKLKKKSQSNLK